MIAWHDLRESHANFRNLAGNIERGGNLTSRPLPD
jgi:hypothetical protein